MGQADTPYDLLIATIASGVDLTEQQRALITSLFIPRSLAKGQFFERPGHVTTHGAFVVRGCFRTYIITDNGNESIVRFSPEGAWIGDIQSATTNSPTIYFVEAIEPSDVLAIDLPSFEMLLDAVPEIARRYRLGLQRSFAAREKRIALSLHASAEERYRAFIASYPSLAGRIPLHMLASYLGMTPETLSRVRTRLK